MTGPEHYRQAEAFGREAEAQLAADNLEAARLYADLGQLHAQLATAAATVLSVPDRSAPRATVYEWAAWQQAAGVPRPEGDDA